MSGWPVAQCVSGHDVRLHRLGLKRSCSLLPGDGMLWRGSRLSGRYGLCVSSDGGRFGGELSVSTLCIKAVLGSPETLN